METILRSTINQLTEEDAELINIRTALGDTVPAPLGVTVYIAIIMYERDWSIIGVHATHEAALRNIAEWARGVLVEGSYGEDDADQFESASQEEILDFWFGNDGDDYSIQQYTVTDPALTLRRSGN